jgi:hypothetical protein
MKRGPERQNRTRRLEVVDDVEGGLEIVLGLVEEGGVHPIKFAPHGETGMQAVVEANAGLRRKRAAAIAGRLGLQVRAAHQRVCPRLEAVAAAADADSAAAAEILHVFILEDRRGEAGDDVSLQRKPPVGEVADRGVGADETGARPT